MVNPEPFNLISYLGDLTATFHFLKGSYKKDRDRLFSRACSDRTMVLK